MAESADRSNLTERYTAIEQAYCADQWGAVIDQGQNLLREIPRSSDPVPEGLKERVQLLMAHAHLYGFNEQNVAEDLYSAVLHSKAEVALRQIAEQGLQQCSEYQQAAEARVTNGEDIEPAPGPGTDQRSGVATASRDGTGDGVAAEPTLAPASETPSPTPERSAADADRHNDSSTEAAPATSGSEVAETTSPAPAAVTAPVPGSVADSALAMPWLAAGAMATGTAAASTSTPTSSVPTPWATAASPAPQPTLSASAAQIPVEEPSTLEATLIPEVVEEPELFEIHQADPALAEELDLTVVQPSTAASRSDRGSGLGTAAAIASAAILAEAMAGQNAKTETPESSTLQEPGTRQSELDATESSPWPERSDVTDAAEELRPRSREAPELTLGAEPVCDLFRNPPAPVEEEDHELMLGLLRVLVSADSAGDGG
jgi:hypothetical protein